MFGECLIMAGGSGTRLWPASSSALPKQFLPIGGKDEGSFFSSAVERALAVTEKGGRVTIIAGKNHIPRVIADCAKLPAAGKKRLAIIAEPEAKNTAPAIACAVIYSLLGAKSRNMLVLTSDHIIKPLDAFMADAALAAACAGEGALAVFGIPPARAETGYGYIETGRPNACGIYPVKAFREKPDMNTAKKFIASKRFFWNSGMFAFSTEFMAGEFRRLAGDVFRPFEKLKNPPANSYTTTKGLRILSAWPALAAAYRKTRAISFDYAIAEKCRRTAMIRAGFAWVDIGSWEDYSTLRSGAQSEVFSENGASCYVDSDIPVALAGVDDLIVVIRSGKTGAPAAALITRRGQTHKVRDIVEKIKKDGRDDLL